MDTSGYYGPYVTNQLIRRDRLRPGFVESGTSVDLPDDAVAALDHIASKRDERRAL